GIRNSVPTNSIKLHIPYSIFLIPFLFLLHFSSYSLIPPSCPTFAAVKNKSSRAVAIWIMIGVGMLIIQVILGGITRLTGSGLSITEWDIITGALPPMNDQQWITEFHKYQLTPQYR